MIGSMKRPLECTLAAIALLVLGACGEESSPLRVVPVAPAVTRVVAGGNQAGAVGQSAPEQLTVLVTDRFDNPVPGVDVTFTVTAGEGSVEPAAARTGRDGIARATWKLGTKAGTQTVTAAVPGLDPVVFSAEVAPGPPDALRRISGDGQTATVGQPLPQPLVVEVTDAYGNPVSGVGVEWLAGAGGGLVNASTATTDAAGRAQATWTLGPRAGEQRLTVIAGQSAVTVFTAAALAGPPTAVSAESGNEQAAPAGSELAQPLVVKVADAHGNGVAGITVQWEVTAGGGSVNPATSVTDAEGLASTRLTLGRTPGQNTVTARPAGGLPAVVFNAMALPFDLSIGGFYLVQSTQTLARDVPLVAGRDAVLRVFVVGSFENSVQPDVYVELFNDGTRVAEYTIPAPSASVPVAVDEGDLQKSWHVFVPGELIQPGVGIRVTVDPDDEVEEASEDNNVFPADGGVLPLDVRTLPPFDVQLIPVQVSGVTGNVTENNKQSYITEALKVYPMPSVNAVVRPQPFISNVTTTGTAEAWSAIINEIRMLHIAEGSRSYYYGVLARVGGLVYCGLGYIGYPVAIGLDQCGGWTAAHEWGHNFYRYHVDCGNPSNPDPNYPYPNGSIGVHGFDPATGQLKRPSTYVDLMSYCTPEWISDYTFRAVLAFREAEAAAQAAYAVAREPSLVVWGRMNGSSLTLEPAFEIETRPALPTESGPYRLQGLGASGDVVFELSFAGEALGHGPADERHFAFAVPASMARADRLERLRLIGPGAAVAERARLPVAARAQGPVQPMLAARGANRVELRWDAAASPLVVVRDPRTGNILTFARGGAMELPTDAAELELIVSDGVRSTRQRMEVQR